MNQKNGRISLLFAGAGEIIIAIASFVFIRMLLSSGETQAIHNITVDSGALWNLVLLYALCAFKLVAGVLAIVFSNKASMGKLLLVLGGLLVLFALSGLSYEGSAYMWIVNTLTLIVPSYYIYGAQQHVRAIGQ